MLKYVEALLLSLIAVFAPVKAAVITAFVLVIIDFITGVWAANKRGEVITSSGFKRTVGKILLYETSICVAFLVETYLTGALLPAAKLVTALVGMAELKSVMENLSSISGSDFAKAVLTKISQSDTETKK